jgi:hypothetical protein
VPELPTGISSRHLSPCFVKLMSEDLA